jgi:hypothetical protein
MAAAVHLQKTTAALQSGFLCDTGQAQAIAADSTLKV